MVESIVNFMTNLNDENLIIVLKELLKSLELKLNEIIIKSNVDGRINSLNIDKIINFDLKTDLLEKLISDLTEMEPYIRLDTILSNCRELKNSVIAYSLRDKIYLFLDKFFPSNIKLCEKWKFPGAIRYALTHINEFLSDVLLSLYDIEFDLNYIEDVSNYILIENLESRLTAIIDLESKCPTLHVSEIIRLLLIIIDVYDVEYDEQLNIDDDYFIILTQIKNATKKQIKNLSVSENIPIFESFEPEAIDENYTQQMFEYSFNDSEIVYIPIHGSYAFIDIRMGCNTELNQIQIPALNLTRENPTLNIDERDIELIMCETSCSREQAIKALKDNDGNIVNAIIDMTL